MSEKLVVGSIGQFNPLKQAHVVATGYVNSDNKMGDVGKDISDFLSGNQRLTPNFDDLMKRLDGLERFDSDVWHGSAVMDLNSTGEWVRFEQVKTVVGQFIADQAKKP